MVKATFEETAGYLVNHGAGHNASMDHAGESNGYDENGKYQQDGIFVPTSPNIMTDGDKAGATITSGRSGATLQTYINSPVNRQPANAAGRTLSIQAMYIHRFGNNIPTAKLPTEP